MTIDEIETPALLVEVDRMERNLVRMQERADRNGVVLRPHTKTHKSIGLARRQKVHGARGITVAKPGEAEVFVDAGFSDVRIAYPVIGRGKYERLVRLMERARISFCVDTFEGARLASEFFSAIGRRADILVEVDTGYGRTGVRWDRADSIRFVKEASTLPGLRLVGILTHAGQSYHGPEQNEPPREALARAAADERDRMLDFAVHLREAGIEMEGEFEISIGSTPTMSCFENTRREGFAITEIRPGNYIFNDAMQVGLGSASLEDCALTVLTTVVSKHRGRSGAERLYLDAGKKVFTSDTGFGTQGYGLVLYNALAMRPMPHAKITGLSEEHGWVQVSGGATLEVGDRVRVVPNHACVAVNTQDRLYLVDGEEVAGIEEVNARGRAA